MAQAQSAPSKKRVTWTSAEEAAVANAAAKLLHTGGYKNLVKASLAAQTILPVAKQRTTTGLKGYVYPTASPLKQAILAKVEELKSASAPAAEEVKASAIPALNEVKAITPGLQPTIYSLQKLMYQKTYDMAESLVNSMVPMFKTAIGQLMDEKLSEAFEETFKEKTGLLTKKLNTMEVIRKKVLVVGVTPDQEQTLGKEFKDVLDLSFVQRGANIKTIPALAASSEVVIFNLDAVNHKYTDQVKGHKGVVMIRGGLAALTNTLIKIYAPN